MIKAGVQFYKPTDAEMQQWVEAAGHQNAAWDDTKKELIGTLAKFDELLEASKAQGKYRVHDV